MTDEGALRRIAACYYAVVTHLDREMATVLRAAESLGLLADTRVAYTSDHGEALGAHGLFGKYTLLDPSAAIPLVMCGPGVPPGRVVDAPVSHVDLYPTLVESAGLRAGAGRARPARRLAPRCREGRAVQSSRSITRPARAAARSCCSTGRTS